MYAIWHNTDIKRELLEIIRNNYVLLAKKIRKILSIVVL